jgi:hypothetical protein
MNMDNFLHTIHSVSDFHVILNFNSLGDPESVISI